MTSVWWVESGEYSSWHIKGIFSTRERAEQYVDAYNKSANEAGRMPWDGPLTYRDIVEKEVDEQWEYPIGNYQVMVSAEGNVGPASWDERAETRSAFWDNTWEKGRYLNRPFFVGYGKTPEHARRAAEDLRREYKAIYGDNWVEPPK